MSESSYLNGTCVWSGAEMGQNHRWVKQFPSIVLAQIDTALQKTEGLDWRRIDRQNFPLPDAAAFFDEVREELEKDRKSVV